MIRFVGEPIERKPVTAKLRKSVTGKRGRPKKASSLSNADRQRAFRERAKAKRR